MLVRLNKVVAGLLIMAMPILTTAASPASGPAAPGVFPSPAVDTRQAELIAAASADATGRLSRSVLEAPLTEAWTVRQAARRLDAESAMAKVLTGVPLAGSPRWQESGICQVRVELSGSAIADLLTVAAQNARDADLSLPKLTNGLIRLRTQTFSAVGQSVLSAEFARLQAELPPGWHGIAAGTRVEALQSARSDAMASLLNQLRPLSLGTEKTVGDVLSDRSALAPVQDWIADRPVYGVEFRTGLECRLTLAAPPERMWPVLRDVISRSGLGPGSADSGSWNRLYDSLAKAARPAIGVSKVSSQQAGQKLSFSTPPSWAAGQMDVDGQSHATGLKGARLAEADALEALRTKVAALPLGAMTLGEAADRDSGLNHVIQTFVQQGRLTKVLYLPEGATVRVSADLGQLWRAISEPR